MFCEKCGNQIPDESKFCPICGVKFADNTLPAAAPAAPAESVPVTAPAAAPIPIPPAMAAAPVIPAASPAPAKKKVNGKLIGIISAVIAAAALIAVVIALLPSGGNYQPISENLYKYFVNDDDIVYLFYGNKLIDEFEVDANADKNNLVRYNYNYYYSNDLSDYVVLTADGALRLLQDGKSILIEEGFVDEAYLSLDGSTVVYVLRNTDDDIYSFNLYKNGKTEVIQELDSDEYILCATCSPDGSAVLYNLASNEVSMSNISHEEEVTYGWNGGDPVRLEKGFYPLMITDGGTHAFLTDIFGQEMVVIENFSRKIFRTDDFDNDINCSADCKSLVYLNTKGDTMVYDISMEEPIKVSGSEVHITKPANTGMRPKNHKDFIASAPDGDVYRFRLKGGKYEKTKLASKVGANYRISSDGKQLMYLDDGELYITPTNEKKPVLIDDMVIGTPYITGDFSHIYYTTYITGLMYTDGKMEEPVKVSGKYFDQGTLLEDGTMVIIKDDELYYSKCGGEVTQVNSPDEAEKLYRNGNAVFVEYDDELYSSKNGIKYKHTDVVLD